MGESMKKHLFIAAFILATIAEIIALIVFALQTPDFSQDTVAVNKQFKFKRGKLYFLAVNGNLPGDKVYGKSFVRIPFVYLNAAIAHRDTVLDITVNDSLVGKVIVYNDGALSLQSQKQTAVKRCRK